jgi:hypothetical protein
MTTSFSKKIMFIAALTSAIVAGAVGTAQAAPDFKHTFEQTQNPTLVFPVMPKPAAENFDNTYRIVNTEMQNKDGNRAGNMNNNAYSPDHDRVPNSGDHHFWRHHGHNIGDNLWWSPDMFTYGLGQLSQYPAETCRSMAIRLENQHLSISQEQAILRSHGCAVGHVSWN